MPNLSGMPSVGACRRQDGLRGPTGVHTQGFAHLETEQVAHAADASPKRVQVVGAMRKRSAVVRPRSSDLGGEAGPQRFPGLRVHVGLRIGPTVSVSMDVVPGVMTDRSKSTNWCCPIPAGTWKDMRRLPDAPGERVGGALRRRCPGSEPARSLKGSSTERRMGAASGC